MRHPAGLYLAVKLDKDGIQWVVKGEKGEGGGAKEHWAGHLSSEEQM